MLVPTTYEMASVSRTVLLVAALRSAPCNFSSCLSFRSLSVCHARRRALHLAVPGSRGDLRGLEHGSRPPRCGFSRGRRSQAQGHTRTSREGSVPPQGRRLSLARMWRFRNSAGLQTNRKLSNVSSGATVSKSPTQSPGQFMVTFARMIMGFITSRRTLEIRMRMSKWPRAGAHLRYCGVDRIFAPVSNLS